MQLTTTAAPISKATAIPAGSDLERRHNALNQPYDLSLNALLARQAARESNARSYPRRIPLALRTQRAGTKSSSKARTMSGKRKKVL